MSRIYGLSSLFVFFFITVCPAQSAKAVAVETTTHFEFYINKWLNLHHFLFQSAKAIARDSSQSIQKFPSWQVLSTEEQKMVADLMNYYQDTWIDKNLLFNKELFDLKRTVSYWGNELESVEDDSHAVIVQHWKAFTPIYDQHYWPEHLAQNQRILHNNLPRIRDFEAAAAEKLSQLSQEPWPSYKVRVDVSYLADWAGAYTTTHPTHVVISTQNVGPEGDWVETLFHEASHKLISSRRGAVSQTIQEIATREGLKVPRQLWHAVLFYFAGKTIQDLLGKEGVDYELFMLRERVFDHYYPALESTMQAYLKGESTLEESLKELMINLQ